MDDTFTMYKSGTMICNVGRTLRCKAISRSTHSFKCCSSSLTGCVSSHSHSAGKTSLVDCH